MDGRAYFSLEAARMERALEWMDSAIEIRVIVSGGEWKIPGRLVFAAAAALAVLLLVLVV
jgi:hypothetical protein